RPFAARRPSRNMFSNTPLRFTLSLTRVCESGGWKSMTGPGEPKSEEGTVGSRSRGARALEDGGGERGNRVAPIEQVQLPGGLVVADEPDVRLTALVFQHDRRDVAAERVGV